MTWCPWRGLPAAELIFLRNRVTPSGCWITRHGHRDRHDPGLAAACGSINCGLHLIRRYPAITAA